MAKTFLAIGLLGLLLSATPVAHAGENCWEDDHCLRLTGVGLGAVRSDDDRPLTLKHLAAMRAAKMDAVRSLAEQAKGIRVQSRSYSTSSELAADRIVMQTDGVLKGVRFLKMESIEPGIYQAVAEMDIIL